MTQREYFEKVLTLIDDEEMVEMTNKLIVALDNKNGKRANAEKEKRAKENAPLLEKLIPLIKGEKVWTASEIGQAIGCSTSKATPLLKSVEGIEISEVSIKGKGKVKGYRLPQVIAGV